MWLLVCCALVFLMVVLGGVTRLTGSGLSMVDWRPVTGILPPLSADAWQRTFEMYQASPEYQKVNAHMDVDDFKGIFWLEYLHRLLGRLVGIVFFVPFVVFAARGVITPREWPKYLLMFALGGAQGLLGWYMVKSGLVDNPNVSQYRLTAHLALALLIYSYMLWVAMSLLYRRQSDTRHPWFAKSTALAALISVTILSGGFVAGLKAGKIFNTFPKMGDYWIPPGVTALEPKWRNFFDNPALVQFDHRVLAITTLIACIACWLGIRRTNTSLRTQKAVNFLLIAVALQASLGIATLLLHVPLVLAASHQAIAMVLLTSALLLVHSLRSQSEGVRD
ncbi:MAG: heme A synthase [Woeseiaceae bacterium]|nr:heme A synthase [Woeseiaceae bacterium]